MTGAVEDNLLMRDQAERLACFIYQWFDLLINAARDSVSHCCYRPGPASDRGNFLKEGNGRIYAGTTNGSQSILTPPSLTADKKMENGIVG